MHCGARTISNTKYILLDSTAELCPPFIMSPGSKLSHITILLFNKKRLGPNTRGEYKEFLTLAFKTPSSHYSGLFWAKTIN